MSANQDIQLFLEQITPKARGLILLSFEEVHHLKFLFYKYPCDLQVALMMINAACNAQERGRVDLEFNPWDTYASEAVNRTECWNDEDLAILHQRIAKNYYIGNDDFDLMLKAREHMRKAFTLAPQNWEIIQNYISIVRPPMDEIPSLIDKILNLAGDDNLMAVYFYTTQYDTLFSYGKNEYRNKVIWGIRRLFDLGIESTHMFPERWRERLGELENQE